MWPASASGPTIPYRGELILIGGNSLKAAVPPYIFPSQALGVLIGADKKDLIEAKYPELADILLCMWGRESSYGRKMIGDKGKAFGHFQIWISKHLVSYDCAMDFECSLDYTARKIKEGKGFLWTSYKKCLMEH